MFSLLRCSRGETHTFAFPSPARLLRSIHVSAENETGSIFTRPEEENKVAASAAMLLVWLVGRNMQTCSPGRRAAAVVRAAARNRLCKQAMWGGRSVAEAAFLSVLTEPESFVKSVTCGWRLSLEHIRQVYRSGSSDCLPASRFGSTSVLSFTAQPVGSQEFCIVEMNSENQGKWIYSVFISISRKI